MEAAVIAESAMAIAQPTDIAHAPSSALPAVDLLQCVALLAGLGGRAQAIVGELAGMAGSVACAEGRTCIDAGSQLMFSLLARGGRNLRVLTRTGASVGGVTPWLRVHQGASRRVERIHAETYVGEPAAAWQRAIAAAQLVGGEDRLRRDQATLGPRGRIYSVAWSLDQGAPYAAVSWQLDRAAAPGDMLAACGVGAAWPVASELFKQLLGHPLLARGPWSIQRMLHTDAPRVRIGTTCWARTIEDVGKRRRLAALVYQLGGDARFAEGIYKLIESSGPHHLGSRIGRAVEIELVEDQLVEMEFYLCVP
jgi:hypothetical protein